MSSTTVSSANRAQIWDDQFFGEYVRENEFSPYMGTDMNSVIQVKEDLTKKRGEAITIPFVTRIAGGVSGSATLEGNEATLNNYGYKISVDIIRNAIVTHEGEEQVAAFDIRDAGREYLRNWATEKMRGGGDTSETSTDATLGKFGIIDNLMSFAVSDSAAVEMYRDASEANKDTWTANNSDRVLFGVATSNNAANDHSANLSNVDSTNDKLTATSLSLSRYLAKRASSRIRPIKTKDGEWFIYFAHSAAFRDLKTDSTFAQATREGWSRANPTIANGEGNPLLRGGDLVYDGVIVREVPEIPYLSAVGNGSINVAPGFLCGAQALGLVWAMRTKSTINQENGSDYNFRFGVGVREMRMVRKLYANSKQWGVVTHYSSAA